MESGCLEFIDYGRVLYDHSNHFSSMQWYYLCELKSNHTLSWEKACSLKRSVTVSFVADSNVWTVRLIEDQKTNTRHPKLAQKKPAIIGNNKWWHN